MSNRPPTWYKYATHRYPASRQPHPFSRPVLNFSTLSMLKTGILNPQLNSLLSRVRHTNTLVIADRGFPFWPGVETIDLSLVDGVPTVLQVLEAVRANFVVGEVRMAAQFLDHNTAETKAAFARALEGVVVSYEDHETAFKPRIPRAIGLVRTGDTTQYANLILTSA